MTPQQERVLAASRRYCGVCQVDFLLPDVCDGGPPITRVPARLHELDEMGYSFDCIGWRSKTKVFRLVDVEAALSRPVASPPGPVQCAEGGLSTDSLFGVPRVAGAVPHWKDAA